MRTSDAKLPCLKMDRAKKIRFVGYQQKDTILVGGTIPSGQEVELGCETLEGDGV